MQKIIEIIEYVFQFQKEFFYSLVQFGIAVIVFGAFYFFRKKLSDTKIFKIIDFKTKQFKFLFVLILSINVLSGLLFALKMPVLGDEAVLAFSSYGVEQGLMIYRDFAAHSTPLVFYVYGLFFKATGVSILSARILSFLFFLLGLYVIYRIFASYFERAYIPLAIFLSLTLLHPSDFSQFFYIGTKEAFAFFVILLSFFFLKNNIPKFLFLSGVFAGLAVFAKLTFLALLPVCFLVILITNFKKEGPFKREALFLLGFFAIIIPALLFFLSQSRQLFDSLIIAPSTSSYARQVTQFSVISNQIELVVFSASGWFLRHYSVFFLWIFLGYKFFSEFRKKGEIFSIPYTILFPTLFILIFGASSALLIPATLNRHLIIVDMLIYFSVAFFAAYFLMKSQWNIKIKKMSFILAFLTLIFTVTNPKQIASYSLLDNSVITQYREGSKLGDLIKSIPEYSKKRVVFLGSFPHLLAQGDIPARKIHPTAFMALKVWDLPLPESLSLNKADYYMNEKTLRKIFEKKENYIMVLEFPSLNESEYKDLVAESFLNQKTIGIGDRMYKIYY
jgi:hypothetical protein